MVPPLPSSTLSRFTLAHGGHASAVRPFSSSSSSSRLSSWAPGDPAHWTERTAFSYARALALRVLAGVQLCASFAYLQYRYRFTIGIFPHSRQSLWYALQMTFFFYELVSAIFPLCHALEVWNVVQRNCVDFKRIPNDLLDGSAFHRGPRRLGLGAADEEEVEGEDDSDGNDEEIPIQFSNYPSIVVVIPCYKEDTDMVLQVVKAAADMDYPRQLFDVYLCDDGRDPMKQAGVHRLRHTGSFHPDSHPPTTTITSDPSNASRYRHVHYVTRRDNRHAKPGNVNHTLRGTRSDLVVQLDADFIARPFLIQRLLPYFFVYNPSSGKYDFNTTLAFVQTPQHYRNMSPHDADYFDQRNIIFFSHILPGKDWFNCASMVGTSNLLSRVALDESNNFPYHSKGDDTALSVIFHGLGYRSYYVNESVATGLAPPSLKGNLSQRNRWYKSDFEILFSKHGALTQRGLSLVQRIMYLAVPMFRLLNIAMYTFDVLLILVLVAGFLILDVTDPRTFVIYFLLHISMPLLFRAAECWGTPGVFKSVAANELFEAVFRYSTLKGMLLALFKTEKAWKLAEKTPGLAVPAKGSDGGEIRDGDGDGNDDGRKSSSGDVTGSNDDKKKIGNASGQRLQQGETQVYTSTSEDSDEDDYNRRLEEPNIVVSGGGINTNNNHNNRGTQNESDNNTSSHVTIVIPTTDATDTHANSNGDANTSLRETTRADQQRTTNESEEVVTETERRPSLPSPQQSARKSSLEISVCYPSVPPRPQPLPSTTMSDSSQVPVSTTTTTSATQQPPPTDRGDAVSELLTTIPSASPPTVTTTALSDPSSLPQRDTERGRQLQPPLPFHGAMPTNALRDGTSTQSSSGRSSSLGKPASPAIPLSSSSSMVPVPPPLSYRAFVARNLRRCWYNVVMFCIFAASLVTCVIRPPDLSRRSEVTFNEDEVKGYLVYDNTLPLALTFVYTLSNVIPHAVVLALCFRRRYVTGWVMPDLVGGRCDEFATRGNGGRGEGQGEERLFVPRSPVTIISVARTLLVFAGIVYTVVFSMRDTGKFIPMEGERVKGVVAI